jgi:replicative DNA helicase
MSAAHVLEMESLKMPANEEAERTILGAILLDPRAYIEAAQTLTREDFYSVDNGLLFVRMGQMVEAAKPIDTVTLTEELARRREIESVGGVAYISDLINGLPRRASIAHYARIHALTPKEFMPEVLHELELQAQSGGLVGLPTGLETLDELTGGLRRGELVVIGAQPGGGKTALACQIVAANAEAGNPIGLFSLEMSRRDLGRRFLPAVTPVSATKIRHPGYITRDEWLKLADGTAEIAQWPIWLDDSGTLNIPELLARARMLVSRMKGQADCRGLPADRAGRGQRDS